MKKIINICFRHNYSGLSMDADIIGKLLEKEGYTVWYNAFPVAYKGLSTKRLKIRKNFALIFNFALKILAFLGMKPVAVTIHLEQIKKEQLRLSRKNMFIANLEWLMEDSCALFEKIDLFVCKTKSADLYFKEKSLPSFYTSFSTISPFNKGSRKVANTFVHIRGKSPLKGTIPLMKVWSKHPEWPELKVISRFIEDLGELAANNITIISGYLDSKELNTIQNETEIHLCPSEAEGFGHYINEPLSCGAIVITVDGYPMNESVQPDRGVLINVESREPIGHTEKFIFSPTDLERKIELVLAMTEDEKVKLKKNARKYFLENKRYFEERMLQSIEKILSL